MGKNKKSALDHGRSNCIFMVRPWDLVWVGILSNHPLAVDSKGEIGRNESSKLLHKILCG